MVHNSTESLSMSLHFWQTMLRSSIVGSWLSDAHCPACVLRHSCQLLGNLILRVYEAGAGLVIFSSSALLNQSAVFVYLLLPVSSLCL